MVWRPEVIFNKTNLSVIIPALNEAANLAHLLPQLREVLGKLANAITTDEMRKLNYEVDANKRSQAEVVRESIKRKGF